MKISAQPSPHRRIAATIALTAFVGSAFTTPLHAIPNSIGGGNGGFFAPAGMRLEDFANRQEMWQPEAKLKGEWQAFDNKENQDDSVEDLRLKNTAVVFGLNASEVTLQRRENQPLQIQVTFSTAEDETKLETHKKLIANITAWSGGKITSLTHLGNWTNMTHENLAISVSQASDDLLLLVFKPVTTAEATTDS